MGGIEDTVTAKKGRLQSPARANELSYGANGFRIVTTSALNNSEEYYAIYVAAEASVTATNQLGGANLSSTTLPAGTWVYGLFEDTSVSASSGTLICYIA